MGVLDLPSPVLAWIDAGLAGLLPPFVRILLWAALGAALSMELYRVLSPQARIAGLKADLDGERRFLNGFDGELEEAWPHIRRMLSLAVRRVLVVFPGTVLASLPLLFVIVWLDSQYGAAFPPAGAAVAVEVSGDFRGRWIDDGSSPVPRAEIVDPGGATVAEIPVAAPVPVIERRHWWNLLIGNPAGYLPDDGPVDRVRFDLPHRQILPVGPDWARGWEVVFFAALVLFAFAYKAVRRIQ